MDIPDVFSEIAVRLDDETLARLAVLGFLPVMRVVLANQDFWYRRTSFLASHASDRVKGGLKPRSDVDWRRIYRTLAATSDSSSPGQEQVIWRHLDYVPALLVLEEVYGRPDWEKRGDIEEVWYEIESESALEYMLDEEFLTSYASGLGACLESAAENGRDELIEDLLERLNAYLEETDEWQDEDIAERAIDKAAEIAARERRATTLELLIEGKHRELDENSDLITAAIEGEDKDVMRYLLSQYAYSDIEPIDLMKSAVNSTLIPFLVDHYHTPIEELFPLFELAVECDATATIDFLLERGVGSDPDFRWGDLLMQAVKRDQSKLVRFILEHDSEVEITTKLINKARPASLAVLLANPRSPDPMTMMDSLLRERHWWSAEVEKNARAILDTPRVRVERLSKAQLETFFDILEESLEDRLRDVDAALRLWTRENAIHVALGHSTFALTLRFLLLKSPSSVQLADWMIEMNNAEFREVAERVVSGEGVRPELTWILALMFAMLYPNWGTGGIYQEIRGTGAIPTSREKELALTMAILDAYP